MKTLEQRVEAALANDATSDWERLISLFQRDPDAFYQLACDGVGETAAPNVQRLATLANAVRRAVRETYELEPVGSGANLTTYSGNKTFVPQHLVARVTHLLREIDGKSSSATPGKDYEGSVASEAEVRFKLGDINSWQTDRASVFGRLESKPLVLRVSEEEIQHLATQPAYITHGLLQSARKTILAPTSVFKGLKRGDDCPDHLQDGWAFCGKPRQAFDNQGQPFPPPQNMVYLAYANEEGFLFDWDWVKESPSEPGYPVDWQLRFGNLHDLKQDAVPNFPTTLGQVTFDPTKACYSSQGDCIFCYMCDDVSYATRINGDLTVFRSFGGDDYTGFKIKNVQRILQVDKTIEMTDAPGLLVSVASVLLATLKRHPEGDVQVYDVLIHALYKKVSEPPKVRVPAPPELAEA